MLVAVPPSRRQPAAQKILVLKSAIGWRAAIGDVAKAHIFVDTPGICASDLRRLAYTHAQSAMFPLDPAAWPGGARRVVGAAMATARGRRARRTATRSR